MQNLQRKNILLIDREKIDELLFNNNKTIPVKCEFGNKNRVYIIKILLKQKNRLKMTNFISLLRSLSVFRVAYSSNIVLNSGTKIRNSCGADLYLAPNEI